MIFEKRGMWKISGYPEKYATFEQAQSALEKINAGAAKEVEVKLNEEKVRLAEAAKAEEDRLEKLKTLLEDSTPYEKMIAKNICKLCNLEPCECFTSIRKTGRGRFEETNTSSS